MVFRYLFYLIYLISVCKADNFPSLLTTNATLAIVIDREFLGEEFEKTKENIENYMIFAKREILKHGGVNVQYFTWTSINVKRDITAILSIASCKDTWRLFAAASDENILHMAISENDCPRMPTTSAFTVPLLKTGEEMPQLLLDLRTSNVYRWKSAVILYDSTLERDIVTRVITALTKESTALTRNSAVSVIKVDTSGSATERRNVLKQTLGNINPKALGRNFLPIVGRDVMELMMDVAKSLGMVNPTSQWLYIISDTNASNSNISTIRNTLAEGDNIAFILNTTTYGEGCLSGLQCHTEEILEAFCKGLEAAVMTEYELASQVSDEEWEAIRPTKSERRNSLLQSVKDYVLQYGTCDNCTSWMFQASETWGKEFQATSAPTTKKDRTDLINVGSWRPSDGTSMTDELFPHVAHGFRGRLLPLISFHNPPWQIVNSNETGQVTFSGLIFDIMNVLAKNLNFTYTVEVVRIQNNKLNTSSSNGFVITDLTTHLIPDKIIQMIKSKEVAMGAAAFTITEANKALINFTMPISTQPYTFLVARPKELGRAMLFMSPFSKDTWFCLAAAIICMGPILYVIHKFSPVYEYKGIAKHSGGLNSIGNCMWFMYGALLQQGGMHLPYSDSARLIVGAWWLVVLVVATTYCGNLVAFLTFPKVDSPIATVEDLLEMRDVVTWSVARGSYLEAQLKVSKEPKYKAIYSGSNGLTLYTPQMLPLIVKGSHVFIDWKLRLQYVMREQYLLSDRCDLALGSDEFFEERLGIILAHGSPYLTKINEEIKRLHQNGLIDKWLKHYLPKKDKCFKVRHVAEVNNHTVNMDDMQGSFFVLFFGFLLAFSWIVCEKLWFKYGATRNQKIIKPFTT